MLKLIILCFGGVINERMTQHQREHRVFGIFASFFGDLVGEDVKRSEFSVLVEEEEEKKSGGVEAVPPVNSKARGELVQLERGSVSTSEGKSVTIV